MTKPKVKVPVTFEFEVNGAPTPDEIEQKIKELITTDCNAYYQTDPQDPVNMTAVTIHEYTITFGEPNE